MTSDLPDIDIRDVGTANVTALSHLVKKHKPKKLHLATYTLSDEAILELGRYAASGIKVVCVAAKTVSPRKAMLPFDLRIRPHNHTKIWILDSHVYIGSCNLSADTITNLMLEVKDKAQREEILTFFGKLATHISFPQRNHVVFG